MSRMHFINIRIDKKKKKHEMFCLEERKSVKGKERMQ